MTDSLHPFVKVRVEEVAIGALIGVGTGIAATSPLTLGLPSLNPLAGSVWDFVQASVLWAGIAAGGGLGAWWAARQERDSHLHGHRYYGDYAQAARVLQAAQAESFSAGQRQGTVHGVTIGGVELARAQEVRHIVCVGTTGAGKTAFLNSIIEQALARGARIVIHDPKGDYTARYYDPQRMVLLGPWDARASMWDAAADIGTPTLADEFAAATVGRVQGENKSFYDGAATVLSGLIQSYMDASKAWTWAELAGALAQTPEAMAAQAATAVSDVRTAVPTAFRSGGDGLSNGDASKFSILSSGTRWIKNYAAVDRPEARRFSITRWLLGADHGSVRIVVLNANAQYQGACEAIFGSVLNAAAAVVNSAKMPERGADEPDGVWLILDELPQLGKSALDALQKIAELGRSRGLRAVLAMQDESQLAAILGKEKAAPMLAVQGARVYMQCSPQMAEEVSRRVGERHVNRIETTSENGATQGKSKRDVTERVIQPSDLTALRPRIHTPPLGVELVLHVGETLGRLLQPFPPQRVAKAAQLVESEAWKFGTLPSRRPTVVSCGTPDAHRASATAEESSGFTIDL